MVWRLIDFALLVLELLMFRICGIIGISKIEFFNFSGNERVKTIYRQNIIILIFFLIKKSINSKPTGKKIFKVESLVWLESDFQKMCVTKIGKFYDLFFSSEPCYKRCPGSDKIWLRFTYKIRPLTY